jgi:antitoxin ParD1/3/4
MLKMKIKSYLNNNNRKIEQEQKRMDLLKEAIEAGERSGYINNFNPINHLAELNSRYEK